jgi:hypothetical protein
MIERWAIPLDFSVHHRPDLSDDFEVEPPPTCGLFPAPAGNQQVGGGCPG